VQKVCSHFAILKSGELIHQGLVEDVSKGKSTVELVAKGDEVYNLLQNNGDVQKVEKEGDHYSVTLSDGVGAEEMNKYLFNNGVIISHLLTKRKSLEKQFLEILKETENA